ncbi:MAG TPA: tetratricopeptide repeat protein [Terracidiphilus sp.]|nr:tetratricopeptide repeat protein [Terracidiphilus sp.]
MRTRLEREVALCMMMAVAGWALPARAQQQDPGQAAMALERDGRTAEAEAAWQALVKQYPRNPQPLAHLGFLEAKQEHYDAAIAYYRKAMALSPEMPGLRLNLGLAYFKQGAYEKAIEMLGPLAKAAPDDERLNVLMGMAHYGLGQFAAASPYLKRASEQDTQNLNLLLTLAHSCLLSNQYPCVLDAYHRMLALNAESAEADMLVGEALDEMKDKQGAIRALRAAVAANPKEPNVHFGLGYLLWTQAAYAEAAEQFQLELENDPQHPQAMLYLADADIQLGKNAEARPLLETLVKTDAKNFKAHLDLGIVDANDGRNTDAIREYEMAAKLWPEDANVHWRLGRLYRAMGRTAEAKAEFARTGALNKAADERLLKVMSTIPAKKKE